MPNPSHQPKKFERLPHIQQISEDHCGPAVIQMLLANLGIEASQTEIAEAAGVIPKNLELYGTRVDQLADAVSKLSPQTKLWYKEHAGLSDIQTVLDQYHYPVAVEWQGLFDEELDMSEDDSDDYGHYSVVTYVDIENLQLIMVDPYKDFADQDRIIKTDIFLKRWWDINQSKKDDRLFFIVTPVTEIFPMTIGMSDFS